MSKLSEALRALKIYNTHGLLTKFGVPGVNDVAVCYQARDSVSWRGSGSYVYSVSHDTDPGSAWYNYKRKTFVGKKSETLDKALAWASEKYNVTEWATCPFDRSAKIPAEIRKAAEKYVKEQS